MADKNSDKKDEKDRKRGQQNNTQRGGRSQSHDSRNDDNNR